MVYDSNQRTKQSNREEIEQALRYPGCPQSIDDVPASFYPIYVRSRVGSLILWVRKTCGFVESIICIVCVQSLFL